MRKVTTTYTCDKCGKVIEYKDRRFEVDTICYVHILSPDDDGIFQNYTDLDLCADCAQEVLELVKNWCGKDKIE